MLSLVSDQRNKSAPLYDMSSNLQNWLDVHWSNPISWLIIVIPYTLYLITLARFIIIYMCSQRWATATLLTASLPLRCLLNLIAALLHPLPNKNSSELSLPLFGTAPFATLKNFLVLFYRRRIYFEKPNPEMLFCKKLLKKTCDLKRLVIEKLWYRKNYFTVHAHTNETQTAETPI